MSFVHQTRLSMLAGVGLATLSAVGGAGPLLASAPKTAALAGDETAETPQSVADDGPGVQQNAQDNDDIEFGTDSGGGPGSELQTGPDGNQIVVEGVRLRGQLDVEQAPILELGEADIAAEGVSSIADLVTQIQNQTGSARGRGGGGRPVILVNGIRPGSFRELFSYPPEALAKVEVFPEEVAQRFGFPPDRRVINLILKDNYASREVELEFEGPARGGNLTTEQELGYLKIADGGRFNVNLTASDVSLLTEDERDIIQTPGSTSDLASDPNQAEFRSLIPDSRVLEGNVSWAKAYLESGISLSANANYERRDSRSLDGLNLVTLTDASGESLTRTFGEDDPLERRTATDTGALAGSLTKPINAFRLTSTFDASLSESTTEIDNPFDTSDLQLAALDGSLAIDGDLPTSADAGFETAFSRTWLASTLNTVRGPLANLPGGELLATFDLGYNWNRLESSDTRTQEDVQLTRGNVSTGANFVIPITSRRNGFADALGSFTLNAQIGLEELSDFGTLGDYNASLNWAPVDGLDLSATYIYREVAPSLGDLGNPQITNFNVPVFDFVNGETVLATVTTGGNPDLPAETQRDWKFAINWELPMIDGARFTVEYIRNRSDDVTSAFPQVTEEIEGAFPDRITRDASGTLIALDRRAVSFSETRSDRLQFRLSARGSIGGGFGGGRGGGRGGPPRGAAAPTPASVSPTSPPSPPVAGAPAQAGGPPAGGPGAGRRGGFAAFRERICADDGLEVLKRIVAAAENGEDVSALVPGLPPQAIERIVARLSGGGGGDVSDEQLAMARSRICSLDPASGPRGARGGPGGQRGPAPAPAGPDQAGRPGRPGGQGRPGGPGNPGQPPAVPVSAQERLCAENGLAAMRELVAKIERGEDVSDIVPGVDPQFLRFGLDRLRADDGSITDAALERVRGRICSATSQPGQQPGQQSGQGGSSVAANGRPQGGPPGAGGGAGGAPRGARGGVGFNPLAAGGRRGWRYFANLTHTIELQNEILIAPGVAVLDQLDGDATGAFGFPRHSSRLEAGLFGQGIGTRLSARYTGETRLDGSETGGSGDLFFNDLATFDIRVFANIDQLTGSKSAALKNLRISLRMDNIFDAQRAVRDENGETPINYQPFVIDPVGRFIGIDIRKLF
ncbi:MAG: hypothetical protein AAGH57_05985 [Pseudomonadota bacterium]